MEEQAIEILKNAAWLGSNDTRESIEQAVNVIIRAMEQPERRTGVWIKCNHGFSLFKNRVYKCSICKNFLDFDGVNAGRGDANYCPNCGARMKIEHEK